MIGYIRNRLRCGTKDGWRMLPTHRQAQRERNQWFFALKMGKNHTKLGNVDGS
jgi:hypothetical protein